MNVFAGLDLAKSALRWSVHDEGEASGNVKSSALYRPVGSPRSSEYDSTEIWGDPFAFRKHVFQEYLDDGEGNLIEKTSDHFSPAWTDFHWLQTLSLQSDLQPLVSSDSILTAAVPDHAAPQYMDSLLDSLPSSCTQTYLLWRPVAIVLAWMDRLTEDQIEKLIGKKVVTLDLDCGYPEMSVLHFVPSKSDPSIIVPLRTIPKRRTIFTSDEFAKNSYSSVLGGLPEFQQLISGQFASELQEAIETGKTEKDMWVRQNGAWEPQRIEFSQVLDTDTWTSLDQQFDFSDYSDCIFLMNGWFARRFKDQIQQTFANRCEELFVMPADSVSKGCSIFSEKITLGLPTYYDTIPNYRIWNGKEARWERLFNDFKRVEPGVTYEDKSDRKFIIAKYNDNVSIYTQLLAEDGEPIDPEDYAHRMNVDFSTFLKESIQLELHSKIQIARGSATFTFAMTDQTAAPVFMVGRNRSKEITVRYTGSGTAQNNTSVEIEPEHRGYPEPQPVLGRIYDNEQNLQMLKAYLKDPSGEEYRQLFGAYKRKYQARNIADRVGYKADPREPTRGLMGTKKIASPEIDKLTHEYALHCYDLYNHMPRDWFKAQNYCHSCAIEEYKNKIRNCLSSMREDPYNFNLYYAPGYVLGEVQGDLDLLLNYVCQRRDTDNKTPILWWSVFRMLCWHPESNVQDASLLFKALKRLANNDFSVCHSGNDQKFVVLAILYSLLVRERGIDIPQETLKDLIQLLSVGKFRNVHFPETMILNLNEENNAGTLSDYVLRFLKKEDTIEDRNLGAKFGGV